MLPDYNFMLQPYLAPIGKEKKDVVCDVNFPHSNTGVPETQINVRPDNLWLVGAREQRPDYKGLSGEQSVAESAKKWKDFSRKLFFLISPEFPRGTVTLTTLPEKGKNFYEKGFYLRIGRQELASICYDGKRQNGTFLIILTGKFCSMLNLRQYRLIYKLCTRFDIKMRRYDLAVDDYAGNVFDLQDIEKRARLQPQWFHPVYRQNGICPGFGKVEQDGALTLYIGSKDSMIQTCVYEKAKESKGSYLAKQFPSWVRYEVRFKAKKAVLDLAMLLPENWLSVVAGSSLYLNSKMKVVGDKFTMAHEKVSQDALERAVKGLVTLRNQYGPMIYDLHSLIGSEALFDIIAREQTIGPLVGLSVYDVPEIMARIDSALGGGLRSSDASDESGEDYLF